MHLASVGSGESLKLTYHKQEPEVSKVHGLQILRLTTKARHQNQEFCFHMIFFFVKPETFKLKQ